MFQRQLHWSAEALRFAREAEQAKNERRQPDGGLPEPALAPQATNDAVPAPKQAGETDADSTSVGLAQPGSESTISGRRRGPKPDHKTALPVTEIVARVAPDGDWRSKLDEICCEFDTERISRPKTWKNRGHENWYSCLVGERHLVVKAIEHHLELAKQQS